jgi:hypothetical protein
MENTNPITKKYALEKVPFLITEWNAILAANMNALDNIIQTRIRPAGAGQTLANGDAVYINDAALMDRIKKARANASSTMPCIGLVIDVIDDWVRIQRVGLFKKTGWTWTVGGRVFVSPDIAGALTQTKPTNGYAQPVGIAWAADTIFLSIAHIWQ